MRKYKKNSLKLNLGFTLLFASLIGGLVLAIGVAMLNITIKQITLAAAGRESQRAFYAADSATECAIFLDRGGPNDSLHPCFDTAFATDATSGHDACSDEYWCGGQPVTVTGTKDDSIAISNFKYDVGGADAVCYEVDVSKDFTGGGEPKTTIIARGYSNCDSTSPNRFERAIETVK